MQVERRLYGLGELGRIAGATGRGSLRGAAWVLARVLRGLCRALCRVLPGVLQRGPLLALRWCALLTEALTAFLRCLRSAYRSVLFLALMGADFSPACGHLQDTFLPPMHRAELR